MSSYCILCLTVAANDEGLLWLARVIGHVDIKGRILWFPSSPGTTLNLNNHIWRTGFLEDVCSYQWITVM